MRLLGTAWLWTVVAAAVGCDQLPDREFASLKGTLTLRVARITPVGAEKTRFDLELTNRGAGGAKACLGPGRSVTGLRGSGSFSGVDHPSCVRDFQLNPGGVLAWSETHDVAVRPGEPVEAAVEVEILNPRRCSSGGCAGFMVASAPLTTLK
jgi:hypothetical protein